jgi:hypothetical protein
MRPFFRLLRLGVRPSHALLLATVWRVLTRFWWIWLALVVAAWFIIHSGK